MITAIALDDEPPALKIIESFCADYDFINLQKTFTGTALALNHLSNFPVDLLFLDIQMPGLNGIDFYRKLQQNTMVIFTTAYSEYAVEGFNLSAVDYLLKPFSKERFGQAVYKANDFYNFQHQNPEPASDFLYIRADYTLYKISLKDILFIESLDDYIKFHLDKQKPIVARMTMKSILEKLPEKDFIRTHRSYIVALSKIEQIRNKSIFIKGHQINIGQSYEAQVIARIQL